VFKESLITYKALIVHQPDSARYYFGVGMGYKESGVFDSAVIWFNKTLSVNPHFCDAYGKLGEVFGQNFNQIDRSEEYLMKAIQCNPKDASAMENMGIVYGIRKDFQKSLDWFMQALKINPGKAALYRNIGQTYMNMGQKDKAQEFFARAQQVEASGKKEK